MAKSEAGRNWLVAQFRASFFLGRLSAGDRLPSVRSLARWMRVSPMTALDLYKRLENDGFVEGRERSGTFLKTVGVDEQRTRRQMTLVGLLAATARKLDLHGVSALDFTRLLLRYTGADRRDDFKAGFYGQAEWAELFARELHQCLRFPLPVVPLSPRQAQERDVRRILARDRTIRCLVASYLSSAGASRVAAGLGIPLIILRLGPAMAAMLEPPAGNMRYILLRDRAGAAALRRLACSILPGRQSEGVCVDALDEEACARCRLQPERLPPGIRIAALDEQEPPADNGHGGAELVASPLCLTEARARYGPAVKPLPHTLSRQTADDVLLQYVLAPELT
jgi:DNA-binding transcriptional regulator YhcF (GntR family)